MYDSLCAEHGGLSHMFIHEAAHAVAAVDRNFAFHRVEVLPPERWIAAHNGFIAGGVFFEDTDVTTWVPHHAAAALEFALAGCLAEREAWGHWLDESYMGDQAWWRYGVGLTHATTAAELEEVLGRPLGDVVNDTRAWVRHRFDALQRVVGAMTGVSPKPSSTVIDVSACRALSESEVRRLVQS